jgi:hypothetical protein
MPLRKVAGGDERCDDAGDTARPRRPAHTQRGGLTVRCEPEPGARRAYRNAATASAERDAVTTPS